MGRVEIGGPEPDDSNFGVNQPPLRVLSSYAGFLAVPSGDPYLSLLFSVQGFRSSTVHQQYDVTPDDQRFVMIRNLRLQGASELIVVENFFEELKAKVGN